MKRLALIAFITCISLASCKKDKTCWECVQANGNNFGEYCDSKKVDELKSQGWTTKRY